MRAPAHWARRGAVIAMLGVILGACGSGPTRGVGPTILTDPATEVVFSGVVTGESVSRQVTVRNVGSSDLVITGIVIATDGPDDFALDEDAQVLTSVPLAPEAEASFTVTYAPSSSGDQIGTLEIASNDLATPRLSLGLRATQQGPHLSCTPPVVDFALTATQTGPVVVTCTSDGTAPFTAASYYIDGSAEFTIDDVVGLAPGTTLAVGDTFQVTLGYAPALAATGTAFLVVRPEEAGVGRAQLPLFGPPMASAGADHAVSPLTAVTLDGTRSRAPGNMVSAYAWTLLEAPPGSKTAPQFTSGDAQEVKPGFEECPSAQRSAVGPCFFADVPGIYRFHLTVTDARPECPLLSVGETCQLPEECCSFSCDGTCVDAGGICAPGGSGCAIESLNDQDADYPALDAEVAVHAIPESGVYVQLTWDQDGDFDLHLVRESADPASGRRWNDRQGVGNDCYWSNPSPDWGVPDPTNNQACNTSGDCHEAPFTTCVGLPGASVCRDTSDDPRLLIDMVTDGGPEALEVKLPTVDIYHIGVDHFPNQADSTAGTATVRVFIEGQEIFDTTLGAPASHALEVSDFWYVGYVVVPAVLSDATFIAAPATSGSATDCNSAGETNPCHRADAADYPAIPPVP